MIKHIVFDLDGTIMESSEGILEGFRLALSELGIEPIVAIDSSLIGPPLRQTLIKLIGESNEAFLDAAVEAFKKHYDADGYKKTILFDGIVELLERLSAADYRLYVATNKRIAPTIKILDFFKIDTFFSKVYALDSFDPSAKTKAELLGKILKDNNTRVNDTVYIGDRLEDGYAADDNGLEFGLALWGFDASTKSNAIKKKWCVLQAPNEIFDFAGRG